MTEQFKQWVSTVQQAVTDGLATYLPQTETQPVLNEAMHYATLNGGKRIRPLLIFASGALYQADKKILQQVASAVEMMHAYSLIHDDMPCMDNDVLRRGMPTVHVKFGEAMALLAGDALQAQAFATLANVADNPTRAVKRMQIFASASGANGMCGGQAIDLLSVGKQLDQQTLEHMHRLKTGALLRASVLLGAYCSEQEPSAQEREALEAYASAIGLAFQVVDDILDVREDTAQLGKTAGKDALENKPTYVSLLGVEQAEKYALTLHQQAISALNIFGANSIYLKEIADLIVNRKN